MRVILIAAGHESEASRAFREALGRGERDERTIAARLREGGGAREGTTLDLGNGETLTLAD